MSRFVLLLTAAFCLSACATDEPPQRRAACGLIDPDSAEWRTCWERRNGDAAASERDRIVRETLQRSGRELREARERNEPAPQFQLTGG